jgi:hypothetical protein
MQSRHNTRFWLLLRLQAMLIVTDYQYPSDMPTIFTSDGSSVSESL